MKLMKHLKGLSVKEEKAPARKNYQGWKREEKTL